VTLMDPAKIRNFSIIAHIDHGKSTLADRFLLISKAISSREFQAQFLDDMDLERERGITIKARTVRIKYKNHFINLIDTPGHIDFTYEVSKSLSACEGVLLLVDASQGIQAQTITNLYLALEANLVIIPVITKIDLPNADLEKTKHEIEKLTSIPEKDILTCSAKSGDGVEDILDAIIERVPPPKGDAAAPSKALVFDSKYDSYKGVLIYLRVMDGKFELKQKVRMMGTGFSYDIEELGIFNPHSEPVKELGIGEVGYMSCAIKDVSHVRVGDTLTLENNPCKEPLEGYKPVQHMVFCGLYPINSKDYVPLREALDKLRLNDSSFSYEPETSASLGLGFRCGFLGLLHMDVIRERLEREFSLDLLITAPNVVYQILKTNGEILTLDNPTKMPSPQNIESMDEPFIQARIIVPTLSLGAVMKLCQERRGDYKGTEYLDPTRAMLTYEIPFSEVLVDFYDKIKSLTSGYGSLNYELIGYKPSDLVKLDILINGEPVDALSIISFREKAYYRGKSLVEKLKEVIPRQLFEVVIQAAIGSKIIARDSIRPMSKNVTAKCYGGDITRKRKLWDRQKEGKKRMKRIGHVDLPQEAFISILKID